ncbi:hypothetical protein AW736_12950 [Termitidicoccus mucosus]|uniref:Mucoidy inhibitor MuiA family protein n=2 Tax=Termitidicoccus mucosus TaxID=1184151 RepID=A0A178IK55_9BACT|nr:hypothetical protein AW736_12950 [Opitutaceae bacterium TSB47]
MEIGVSFSTHSAIIPAMNKTRILALCLSLAAPASLFATMKNPSPMPSQITAATVYTDRAIVTRAVRVELPAGQSEIVLEKLPAALIDASVQVSGRGTASATILDVSTRVIYTADNAEVDQPRVKALQDEITAVEQAIRALDDRAGILNQQAALVEKIENAVAAPPGKDATARPVIDDLQKLLAFSLENRARLATERQSLDRERDDANKKLNALRSQLNEILHGARAQTRSYKTVTVRVAAAQAGSLDLKLAYTVPGAGWTPAYDARLRAEDRAVELSYFGVVRQGTGEDWNDIALTLSTARPALGGAAPELPPRFLDVYVPRPVMPMQAEMAEGRIRGMAMDKMQTFKVAEAVAAPMPAEVAEVDATLAAATVDTAATSASFRIAAATSIPSDNSPQKVSITTATLPAKLQYQAVPAMQETAFLSAYVTNGTEFPLLAGAANIFLDDAFVATASLKTVMPTEKFELSLGADEGVAVKRRVVNRFTENTGLTGKGRRVTCEFLVTITNNKKTAERVVFKEALPLSRNEKIVVNLLAPSSKEVGTPEKPGREVTLEEENKLVWRLDLKPGETREITYKYNVEYPGDLQITGLD